MDVGRLKMETQKKIEIAVGVVFVVLLAFACVWAVNSSGNSPKISVTNSYNTYNYYIQQPIVKPYIVDHGDYSRVYYVDRDLRYSSSDENYLDYSDSGRVRFYTGVFGNEIPSYEVVVRNNEYINGNFKVTFYFRDRYGREDSKSLVYPVSARDEHKFVFRDVTDNYQHSSWYYKVESLTRTPTTTYYN